MSRTSSPDSSDATSAAAAVSAPTPPLPASHVGHGASSNPNIVLVQNTSTPNTATEADKLAVDHSRNKVLAASLLQAGFIDCGGSNWTHLTHGIVVEARPNKAALAVTVSGVEQAIVDTITSHRTKDLHALGSHLVALACARGDTGALTQLIKAAEGAPANSGAAKAAVSRDSNVVPVQVFRGEWDAAGVYFYQAYNDAIADWAIAHQAFGGPIFKPTRMTWIKPSFAWVLYRSGYASKHNQTRILKIKLSHKSIAALLSQCQCKHGGGGSLGRVQWDPARDLMSADGREPRRMLKRRAVQIGLKGRLSQQFVQSVIQIQDVTALARSVGQAHKDKTGEAIKALIPALPNERPYTPPCDHAVLVRLRLRKGDPFFMDQQKHTKKNHR